MRAYRFDRLGAIDDLKLLDVPLSAPVAGEVTVRMRAASLNYRDLLIAGNNYPGASTPIVPLSDAVGEIVACGPAVTRWKIGDRVLFSFFRDWIAGPIKPRYMTSDIGGRVDGVLAECMTVNENWLVACPDYLSDEEAAGLGCASVTAWSALMSPRPLRPGETVLIQGSGGVSIFALQFARMMGAAVIALTSSPEKAQRLRDMGAEAVVNYKTSPNWHEDVRTLTGGKGADRIVEVGGPATFERSTKSLGANGVIAIIGLVGGLEASINPFSLFGLGTTLHSINVGSRDAFEDSLRAMTLARIIPVIDRVFPFERAQDAYRYLESQKHMGKVVITGPA